MLLLTLRGTPTLFYGDELGLPDQDVPADRQRDWFGLTAGGVSRDPTRTPMPWDGGPNAGFSAVAEAELWLPVARDHARLNVAAQLRDPGSMLELYRRLLRVRRDRPALTGGGYAELPRADAGCLTYVREARGERVRVALNLTGAPQRIAGGASGRVLVSTTSAREGEAVGAGLVLAADEAIVVDEGAT